MAAVEEKQRIPVAQGLPWTTDEPEVKFILLWIESLFFSVAYDYVWLFVFQNSLFQWHILSHVVMFAIAIIDSRHSLVLLFQCYYVFAPKHTRLSNEKFWSRVVMFTITIIDYMAFFSSTISVLLCFLCSKTEKNSLIQWYIWSHVFMLANIELITRHSLVLLFRYYYVCAPKHFKLINPMTYLVPCGYVCNCYN